METFACFRVNRPEKLHGPLCQKRSPPKGRKRKKINARPHETPGDSLSPLLQKFNCFSLNSAMLASTYLLFRHFDNINVDTSFHCIIIFFWFYNLFIHLIYFLLQQINSLKQKILQAVSFVYSKSTRKFAANMPFSTQRLVDHRQKFLSVVRHPEDR